MSDVQEKLYRRGLKELIENNQTFRQFVLRMVTAAGIHAVTHLPGHSDTSAYNEGRRSLGLDLLLQLQDIEPMILARLVAEGGYRIADRDEQPQPQEDDE